MFSAIVIDEAADGIDTSVREVDDTELPEGDVTIDVAYSTVNYKDALAMLAGQAGRAPVPDGARHRRGRHGHGELARQLERRRRGGAERVGRRRGALGRAVASARGSTARG